MPDEIEKAANAPVPTKEPRQRSLDISDMFLTRYTVPWSRVSTLNANTWRAWVLNQPVALVCRETLIANLEALDWKIVPRNMKYKDELEPISRYYTKLISRGGNFPELGLDYTGILEWVVGDLLDTPFGGFAEIGRKEDKENGRVVWIKPIDASTLYPTGNGDFPVVQYYMGQDPVPFPKYAQSRVTWSPQPHLLKEGWGIAPPEKIYFALELLNKGDRYYANLLDDVPSAGILDLGDMEAESAKLWIDSFRSFLNDANVSFKIPVLYEHNNKVEFIPFGKPPTDLMFDRITLKYAGLVCGAYGMSLSDIGLQESSGGSSLAGSIRQERKTRKTGFARVKSKWASFWNSILPDTLEFVLVDYDDELNVAMGRARLASATAFNILTQAGSFSPQEVRSQVLQDGLMSIPVPDQLPPEAKPQPQNKPQERPGALGHGVPPAMGGEGNVKSLVSVKKVNEKNLNEIVGEVVKQLYDQLQDISEDEMYLAKSYINNAIFDEADTLEMAEYFKALSGTKIVTFDFKEMNKELKSQGFTKEEIGAIKSKIEAGVSEFLAKASAVTMMEVLNSEVVIDNADILDYDYIVQEVQKRMRDNISDFVSVHVQDILDETKGRNDDETGS